MSQLYFPSLRLQNEFYQIWLEKPRKKAASLILTALSKFYIRNSKFLDALRFVLKNHATQAKQQKRSWFPLFPTSALRVKVTFKPVEREYSKVFKINLTIFVEIHCRIVNAYGFNYAGW